MLIEHPNIIRAWIGVEESQRALCHPGTMGSGARTHHHKQRLL
jgi:hypothetical protein